MTEENKLSNDYLQVPGQARETRDLETQELEIRDLDQPEGQNKPNLRPFLAGMLGGTVTVGCVILVLSFTPLSLRKDMTDRPYPLQNMSWSQIISFPFYCSFYLGFWHEPLAIVKPAIEFFSSFISPPDLQNPQENLAQESSFEETSFNEASCKENSCIEASIKKKEAQP